MSVDRGELWDTLGSEYCFKVVLENVRIICGLSVQCVDVGHTCLLYYLWMRECALVLFGTKSRA